MTMLNLIGLQLGNYRLVAQIGHGGYAEIYLGQHIYLETQVAIKVLHARLTESEEVERFRDEARMIGHLVHPHIVRLLDFGIQDDIPYLVMDYAPNGTLRTRYPKGTQLTLETILLYVRQIADALHYAHAQKLVHRDVKPENMLLGPDDNLLLSDFGTALVVQTTGYQSPQQETVIGTIAYMAPELFEGKARPASDQYALGIAVYEWLAGHTPFHGYATDIAVQHATTPPPPLRDSIPTIPVAVEQVIMRALAKDYHQRFPDVLDFADALEKAATLGDDFYEGEETAQMAGVAEGQDEETHLLLRAPEVAQAASPAGPTVIQPAPSPGPQASPRPKKSFPVMLLLLLILILLIAAGVIWLALAYLPGILSTHSATIAPTTYPRVAGTYSGSIDNMTSNITTSMELSIQQSQGTIGGMFTVGPPLQGNGPFTGTITPARHIQFTVESYHGNAPLYFYGSMRSDGSLAGDYCSLDQNGHCSTKAGASGTWKVAKSQQAGASPTSAQTTIVPTDAPAEPPNKGHHHHHDG